MKRIILALSILALVSCKKDTTEKELPAGGTASLPFAKLKRLQDGKPDFQWTYTRDKKISSIKWESFQNETPVLVANITSITYSGDMLSKIEANSTSAGNTVYAVIYKDGKFQKVTSTKDGGPNVWNYEVEYDGSGKIVQVNRYRSSSGGITNSSSYSLTYDSSGNISGIKWQQGAATTNYSLKYDTKENKAYNNLDMRIISIGEISTFMNHFWGIPFMLTLTKNNVIEMTTVGSPEKHIYSYEFDADQNIKKVSDDWTVTAGTKILNEWVITK